MTGRGECFFFARFRLQKNLRVGFWFHDQRLRGDASQIISIALALSFGDLTSLHWALQFDSAPLELGNQRDVHVHAAFLAHETIRLTRRTRKCTVYLHEAMEKNHFQRSELMDSFREIKKYQLEFGLELKLCGLHIDHWTDSKFITRLASLTT